MSTNAPATTSALEGDGYTTSDFRTEDQWLGEVNAHKSKRKELVRLWFVNKFGSQSKLAKHLDCGTSTVQRHVEMLLATGELTEEHYQKKMCNSRKPEQTGPKRAEPVENSTSTSTTTTVSTNDQPVQHSNTEHLLSRDVPAVQPNVGSYCDGRAAATEALETNHESSNDAERTYTEICQLLNQARKKIYEIEKYEIGPDVWASIRAYIGGCSDVANCHRFSEDVLPLRNITND